MKPYIEYEGKTYEFEANFYLQKEFKKEYRQQLMSKKDDVYSNVANNEVDMKEIATMQKEIEDFRKEIENKDEETQNKELQTKMFELMSKYPSVFKLLNSQNDSESEMEELNEKYCRIMFETKYPNEIEVFDNFVEQVCEEQGIDYVQALFKAIIEKVFIGVVRVAPPQKHSFAWETNKAN